MPIFRFLKKTVDSMIGVRQFYEPGGYLHLWRIGWPLILLSSSNTIMLITNRAFLAWSSPNEVAASMPAGQMFFTLMAFFLITTGFTATIVAQFHGAGNRTGCVKATWNGFYFGTIFALLLTLILPAGGDWIFMHNGHDPDIASLESEYFTAMVPCAAFACMETAFLSFFTGRGKTVLVAVIKVAGCLVCVPLNYMLIFGEFGLPRLGILGGGLANSIANFCTFAAAFLCFLLVNQKEYATRCYTRPEWEYLRKLLFFGTPAGFQTFIRNAAFAIVIMLIGSLGKEALTATSIAVSINMLGAMPMIGLMDATSIVTGQCIGRRLLTAANRVAVRSFRMVALWMSLAAVFYVFFPDVLIQIFGVRGGDAGGINMSQVRSNTIMILQLAVIFNYLDALRFMLMGNLRGAGDTKIPLLISIGTSWFFQLPGTILLVWFFHSSLHAVWILLSVYIGLDALLMYWRKRTGAWRNIKVVDLPPASPDEEAALSREI